MSKKKKQEITIFFKIRLCRVLQLMYPEIGSESKTIRVIKKAGTKYISSNTSTLSPWIFRKNRKLPKAVRVHAMNEIVFK